MKTSSYFTLCYMETVLSLKIQRFVNILNTIFYNLNPRVSCQITQFNEQHVQSLQWSKICLPFLSTPVKNVSIKWSSITYRKLNSLFLIQPIFWKKNPTNTEIDCDDIKFRKLFQLSASAFYCKYVKYARLMSDKKK